LILFLILHYKDPGYIPIDKSKQSPQLEESSFSKHQKKAPIKTANPIKTASSENSNKFNIRRFENNNKSAFNEKNLRKTLDVSLMNNDDLPNHIKAKEEYEDSNEILEVVELNNIADDIKDAENVVLDYNNPEILEKDVLQSDKTMTFAFKNEISLKHISSKEINSIDSSNKRKINEVNSIVIEINSKNKVKDSEKDQSKFNSSLSFSPPSISSSL